MSRATSVIEINGTSYDAITGDVIGTVKKVASHAKDQTRVIDGFVRKSSNYAKAKTEVVMPKKRSAERQIKTAKQIHNRTQRSRALMRNAVSRPKAKKFDDEKKINPSLSNAVEVESERRSRANAVVKDKRVNRFGSLKPAKDNKETPRTEIIAQARPVATRTEASTTSNPLPSMVASASHQKLERMLDEALVRADAHKQMLKKRSRNPLNRFDRLPRWLSVLIILIIVVIALGLLAWRMLPQVAIRVASYEAHVSASLPSYTPVGYAVAGSISHTNDSVTIKYQDKSNSSYSYNLTEKGSSWDSASLAANVLNPDSQVQTSQVQGTTVYIYGKQNSATWVNNGVWYTLNNKANLSSDEILNIVQSL